ncbi:Acetyltransferase (GNAT) family protein [Lentzea waywayandensis]|uniref:Acetyltransferase (GNAT) family protein n=1 Tax=Lentzea waywayandensis TaxID=84724 RepID=A0A1I6ES80_9PSEU|nr:GNAT family N-acetyltransferase [Lentzea waywayandensis]SFR20653.1 Acetyltransferase (GNAT) family protein [Lentzea waywayandensis]
MQIHQVMPDDWELWRDIRLDALASDPEEFGSTLAREQTYTENEWRDRAAEGLKLVALDARPVALVAATAKPEGLYLYSMWVRDSHRGRGVGEALVRTVQKWAAEEGWKIVRLRVYDHNLPARRLYERLGFVDAEEPEHMEFRVS